MKTRGLLLSVTDNRAKPLMNQLVVRVSSLSFSSHLCVGFLFLILYPGSASRLPPSHIIFHTKSLSHHFFTHTIFVNHHLSPTIFVNHLCQPTSFTHIFVNHICPPPSFTRHLSHTPSFTHHLCLTIFHTPSFPHHLCHTLTSTFVSHGRRGTWRHLLWFCVAGVALGDIHLGFASRLGPHLFSLSCLSRPMFNFFFGYLLEEVDIWA